MRFRKGQTAMEYLMTYGWAILVIMVVLAVLFYLGILNPRAITPTQCSFPPGFTCISWKLFTNGSLYLQLGQGFGKTINITGFNCTENANVIQEGGVIQFDNMAKSVLLPSAAKMDIASGAYPQGNRGVNCTSTGGTAAKSGAAGDNYNGKLYINYTETDTNIIRIVIGSISAKYEV